MKRSIVFLVFILLEVGASGAENRGSAATENPDRIKPYAADSRYWQYKGEPVLLVGGTKDDSLYQIPDLKEHLDLLASVGGNYIRNTMSARVDKGFEVQAFKRLETGKYDLEAWNDEHWTRFENLLRWTHERDVIIQIEVWDRFDYTDAREMNHWQRSPYRPANNVNYPEEETGLADRYPDHPARNKHPFFHTIPGMKEYRPEYDLIRKYQERFVAKMLSHSLPYGNVLYCMNNETSTSPRWGQYWMEFIRAKAKEAGVEVYATDMFDDGFVPESSEKVRLSIDRPDIYSFIDISQVNSRNFNEDHWNRLRWVVDQVKRNPRPVNHTKIYGSGHTSFGSGSPEDGVERFWRNILGGSASARFHRDGSGNGLQPIAQASLKAVRKLETRVKMWDVEPQNELLGDRSEDEAYLAASPGKAYALYFT
ncbi:MAG: hypothetical protein ABIK89_13715, partial [Planctomycetota bacterium]